MRERCINWVGLWMAVGVIVLASTANAGTVFYDNFSDGDPQDGEPVTWVPDTDESITAEGGDLVIADSGWARANVLDLDLKDTSIRTQLRLVRGDWAGLMTRWDPRLPNDGTTVRNYYSYIGSQGEVGIGLGGPAIELVFVDTDLRPMQEDVMMQLDAIGSQISLWVWRPDETMPSDPTVTVTNSVLTAGDIAVYSWNEGGPVEGIYRFVHVADAHIPEPSTLLLALLALGVVGGWRKWGR